MHVQHILVKKILDLNILTISFLSSGWVLVTALRWTNRQDVPQHTLHSLCSSAVTCFYQRWRQVPKLQSADLNSGVLIHDCELQINYTVCGCFTVSCKNIQQGIFCCHCPYINLFYSHHNKHTRWMDSITCSIQSPSVGTTNPAHTSEGDDCVFCLWLSEYTAERQQQQPNRTKLVSFSLLLIISTSRLHMCSKQN